MAVVGTSGSGKSTLLHVLAGLVKPNAGKVYLQGESLYDMNDDRLTRLRRRKMGFVFQFFNLITTHNVIENIVLPIHLDNRQVEERNYVLKIIKNTFKQTPNATVGILLRNNFQVAQWINFINDSGLKSITRSESLEQKTIFKTIFSILKILLNPFDNEILADNYEILAEMGFYKPRLGTEI